MNNSLGAERLYVIGQFKNLKLNNTVSEIPQDILLNSEAMGLLRKLQIDEIELTYLKYVKDAISVREDVLNADIPTLEEYVELVQDSRINTFEQLLETLASENTPEENSEE